MNKRFRKLVGAVSASLLCLTANAFPLYSNNNPYALYNVGTGDVTE